MRLKDIKPTGSAFSNISPLFTGVNGTLFFRADDGSSGLELWKSDGTEAGTVRVKDINVATAGSSPWAVAGFAGMLGAGFGFVNTPLAATISRTVQGGILSSALSINSMVFFLGGSLGTAVFMAIGASNFGGERESWNPLHSGTAAGFSDAFLLLAVPVVIALALSFALPRVSRPCSPVVRVLL